MKYLVAVLGLTVFSSASVYSGTNGSGTDEKGYYQCARIMHKNMPCPISKRKYYISSHKKK